MTVPATRPAAPAANWPRLELRWGLLVAMAVVVGGFFALSLAVGSVSIPLNAVIAILFDDVDQKRSWSHIIHAIRLPRALTAVLAGAALSASGLQMQTLFRNPLADPYIVGVSGGAALGGVLAMVLGATSALWLPGAAFLGAALSTLLLFSMARRSQQTSGLTLLLIGVVFNAFAAAIITFIKSTIIIFMH